MTLKHTLKTRPKLIYLEDVLSKNEYADFIMMLQKKYPTVFNAWKKNADQKTEQWFEEFEKELRRRMVTMENNLPQVIGRPIYEKPLEELITFIKEVLGVAET